MVIDTHCHIHDSEFYPENREDVYRQSRDAGVVMLCVGTTVRSSREAVAFAETHEGCYAAVGIHPHDGKDENIAGIRQLLEEGHKKIIAIGEIGLDYFYEHSPREVQRQLLRDQLALAQEFNLPVSFHVRDAYDDFWPIFDSFSGIRGVMHSFTDTQHNLEQGLKRGLLVGINGISTFTKEESQQRLYTEVPLEKIVLETDAPFLTPKPFRGKMNLPAYVGLVAKHQAALKGVGVEDVEQATTDNAERVFGKMT